MQNLYIVSCLLDIGCCAIGGFCDNEIDKIIDIQETSESTIYALAIGKS